MIRRYHPLDPVGIGRANNRADKLAPYGQYVAITRSAAGIHFKSMSRHRFDNQTGNVHLLQSDFAVIKGPEKQTHLRKLIERASRHENEEWWDVLPRGKYDVAP